MQPHRQKRIHTGRWQRTDCRDRKQPKFVAALAHGLDVLACFKEDPTLDCKEIARRTGLRPSTVQLLTHTLTELGYLSALSDAGYRLGAVALTLGSGAFGRTQVRDLAGPLMQGLAEATGTSVALGTRDGLNIVCIEVKKSNAALALRMEVGTLLPLVTSAIGRAYLAVCSRQECSDLIAKIGLRDVALKAALEERVDRLLAAYDILGACASFGEWQPEVNGIAVGFQPGNGLPPMSITCGAPAFTAPSEFLLHEVRPQLIKVVRRIEECLGQTQRRRGDRAALEAGH